MDYTARLDEFLTRLGVDAQAPLRCISGEHQDAHPSMRRHNAEWWHCFSCGNNFNIYHFAADKLGVALRKENFRQISEFIEDTLDIPRGQDYTWQSPRLQAVKASVPSEPDCVLEWETPIDEYTRQASRYLKTLSPLDRITRDLTDSNVGWLSAEILRHFKQIPLSGAPNRENVFAHYFSVNLYPRIIYTKEVGFYIYNAQKGMFQTEFADAVVHQLIIQLTKFIEGFEISTYNKIAGVMKSIALHPLVFKLESEFDRSDTLLNTDGQIFSLYTFADEQPSAYNTGPENLIKMSTSVKPADMPTPIFDRFLQDITLGDAAMAEYLLRFMGYALTGLTKEQIFLNLFGKGKNGKSTLLELLLYIFGSYATTIAEDLVIDGAASTKTENSAADLQNKRLAVIADCNRGALNDSMIKKITGGDTLRARKLYHESFEFIPKCKLIIGANQKLRLRDTGESIKRRLRLVPFEYKAEEPDKLLLDKLKAEAPGILYKLMREAAYYLSHIEERTFPYCERIARESAKYFDDENPFGLFFKERLEFAQGQSAKTVEVWEAYKTWAEANGVKPLKKQSLFAALEDKNCKIQRMTETFFFLGLKIN